MRADVRRSVPRVLADELLCADPRRILAGHRATAAGRVFAGRQHPHEGRGEDEERGKTEGDSCRAVRESQAGRDGASGRCLGGRFWWGHSRESEAGGKKPVRIGKWRPTRRVVQPIGSLTARRGVGIENGIAIDPAPTPFPRARGGPASPGVDSPALLIAHGPGQSIWRP
jgi:hypothetical protein